jgi:hypothetical protein
MTDKPRIPTWWEEHRKRVILFSIATVLIVPFLGISFRMNGEDVHIDLSTGRVRTSRYIYCIRIRQTFEDTPVSEVLRGYPPVGDDGRQDPMGNLSHDVSSPIRTRAGADAPVGEVWEAAEFTPEARVKTARQFLRILREGRGDRASGDYVQHFQVGVWEEMLKGPVAADDIPDDLVEQVLAERKARIAEEQRQRAARRGTP